MSYISWRKKPGHTSIPCVSHKCSQEEDKRIKSKAAVCALLIAFTSTLKGNDVDSDIAILFDIPQERAEISLIRFAEQANLRFIVPHEKVEGVMTNRLLGPFTASNGLNALLRSTGLVGLVDYDVQLMIVTEKHPGDTEVTMNEKSKNSLLANIALSLLGLFSAQTAIGQTSSDNEVLEEIVVQAKGIKASLARAVDIKRDSNGIVDAISAEDIGDFPDLNISESLQRITGVTIERTLGEGKQVSVRGLRPEFTQVLINGLTVSSGNRGREVEFDVFASEVFTGLEVAKTHSASALEGGLAGTIDMRTAKPLDFDYENGKPLISLSAQGGYNQLADELNPAASGLISAELMDGKLGILASASYTESFLRQDNAEGLRFRSTTATVNGAAQSVEYPFLPRYLVESVDRERLGITGALQFAPTNDILFGVDIAYAEFDELRNRYSLDTTIGGGNVQAANITGVDSTGLITGFVADPSSRPSTNIESIRTPQKDDLLHIGMDGEWDIAENWNLSAKYGYSKATRFRDEFRSGWRNSDTGELSLDLNDGIFYGISLVGADIFDPTIYDDRHQARFLFDDIDDEEHSFRADVERFVDGSIISSFAAGYRYNKKEKVINIADNRTTANAATLAAAGLSLADFTVPLPIDDFFDGTNDPDIFRTWPVGNFDAILADPTLVPPTFDQTALTLISSSVVEEKTDAGYFQANIDGDLGDVGIRGNVGVRLIQTTQSISGFAGTNTPVSAEKTYTEALPNIILALNLTDDIVLRTSAARSVTRPTLTSLSPGGSVAVSQPNARFGNPDLDPFTADNYDLSAEWYFGEESLLSLALFHKDVNGFITNVTSAEVLGANILGAGDPRIGTSFQVTRPVNGDKAFVRGYEVAIQTPLNTFSSGFLQNFGILANYTFVDSESTIEFNNQIITTLLPGQSKSSYNIVGYYEDDRFSIRLAYAWRDEFLDQIRTSQTERSNFIDAYGQLDLSAQYNFSDNISFTFEALNLLEEEQQRFGESLDRNVRFSETGRFFHLGARVRF